MFVFSTSASDVTYWNPTHVRHFGASRLRATTPGAVQVLKWEKAFHSHSSADVPLPKQASTEPPACGVSPPTHLGVRPPGRCPLTPPLQQSSESLMNPKCDPRPRRGMSPALSCATRRARRPRAGQEESYTPIWIMCSTNVNIWKKWKSEHMGTPPGMNRSFVKILAALLMYFMETNNFRWADSF